MPDLDVYSMVPPLEWPYCAEKVDVVTFISWTLSMGGPDSWLPLWPEAYPKATPSKKFSAAWFWPPFKRELNALPRNIGSPFGFIGVNPGWICSSASASRMSPPITTGRLR